MIVGTDGRVLRIRSHFPYRYEAFREDIEIMTDDRTRRKLLSAADWTEAGGRNSVGDDGTQNVDAEVGKREA